VSTTDTHSAKALRIQAALEHSWPVSPIDHRRRLLQGGLSWISLGATQGAYAQGHAAQPTEGLDEGYPAVLPGHALRFPDDHGAHPRYRIEWWYLTGWLGEPGGRPDALGVQITFFRVRTGHPLANPSRFSPAQLLFAHVALADPRRGRLLHLERAARPGFGLAEAVQGDTRLRLGRWSMIRTADDRYQVRIAEREIDLNLEFAPPGPPILQGHQGFSPKGPSPHQASYYYSRPALGTRGRVNGRPVQGLSWYDHEWSSELLDAQAQGWDWAGLHFDDGRALMVFRIRDSQQTTRWTQHRWISPDELEGTLRPPRVGRSDGVTGAAPGVHFTPLRHWRSARTGVIWPVALRITIGAFIVDLEPLFDDQELDARGGTGVLYWEGAVRVRAPDSGTVIGRGYLELTGYGERLRL
jgi:predicted secreted hydrolase